ncbi:MFS transporter [Actinomyces oricola]
MNPGHGAGGTFTALQRHLLPLLLVPAFVSLLAVSSVNVILPAVSRSVETSTSGLALIVSGYSLVFGVLLVPAGRAGDVMGRGRLFVVGLLLFGLGSLATGLAPTIVVLNASRLLMGVGAGLFNPQVTGLIQQFYAAEARGRAFGLFGGVIGVSVAVGPVLSGGLIAALGADWGWRASFLINVPFALAGAWAARRHLPPGAWRRVNELTGRAGASGPAGQVDPGPREAAGGGRADFDPVGMSLLALATVAVMAPFMEYARGAWVWSLLVLGVIVTGIWVAWERRYRERGRQPMVDLSLLRVPSFAFGCLAIAIYFLGYTSVWIIVAQYLQTGLGKSALASGLMGVPAALCAAVLAAVSGRRVMRVGRAMVLWGMILGIVGLGSTVLVVHLRAAVGLSPWWMAATLSLLGVGQGLVVSPNQTLSLVDVPLEYAGAAGGILQTGERIGTAIGIAAFTGIAFRVAEGSGWDTAAQVALGAIAGVILVSAAVALADLCVAARRR